MTKALLPTREPFRLDLVTLGIQKRLFVAFYEQSKGQHVAIDGLVTNAFACLTLYIREE